MLYETQAVSFMLFEDPRALHLDEALILKVCCIDNINRGIKLDKPDRPDKCLLTHY